MAYVETINGLNIAPKDAVRAFDTVADMQAATDLAVGMVAHTNGFHTSGDGGAAYYNISASGTADGVNVIGIPENNPTLYANFVPTTGVVSIDAFAGETNEDKLYAALDYLTVGVIECGEVTITKKYTPTNKDYRHIIIRGATINLTIDNFFDQSTSYIESCPSFDGCVIMGNNHVMYDDGANLVGSCFRNCFIRQLTVFSTSGDYYIQSPNFIGCIIDPVDNLITALRAYDLHIIGCTIGQGSDSLIILRGNFGGGSLSDSSVDGRQDVLIRAHGFNGFSITNNYFENLRGGLLHQDIANSKCAVTVANNLFYPSMPNATYMCLFTDTAKAEIQASIHGNQWMVETGYIANVGLTLNSLLQPNADSEDPSVLHNGAFAPDANGRNLSVFMNYRNATYDSSDSTWEIKVALPYKSTAYMLLHPFYIYFVGNYDNVNGNRQGFAIIRCTPYTYNDGTTKIGIDATIVDSRNYNGITGTSTVAVAASVNNTAWNSTDIEFTFKISGFSSSRGYYSVVDPFYMLNMAYV